ncbi:MAG: DUF2683 family protein [Candidatus Altiarchaeota archaeon]
MVQAIINIEDQTNRVINMVKAKYGLRDKSEAINVMAQQYEEKVLEPQLRPEYVKKARLIMKQKPIKVGTVGALRKRMGLT